MFLSIADSIESSIKNGIDLLRDGVGIDVTAITFIMQICATIVLFLFVRFCFWKKVTNMIDKRKNAIQKELDEKVCAQKEAEAAKQEAVEVVSMAKNEANDILKNVEKISQLEAESIKQKALEDIDKERRAAKEQIENDREKMEEGLRDEIITVAYALAEKITEKEIDQNKNEELVDNFLKKVGK